MSNKVRAERSTADCKEVFLNTVKDVFSENAAKAREAVWEWSSNQNPASVEISSEVVLLKNESVTFGAMFLMPSIFSLDTEKIPMHWVGSIMVQKQHRGKGLLLVKYLIENESIPKMGLPFEKIVKMYQRYGGGIIAETEQFFCVLSPSSLLRKKRKFLSVLAKPLDCLIRGAVKAFLPKVHDDIYVSEVARFNDSVDFFWREVSKGYDALTVRDQRYLNWRFADCPLHEYKLVEAKKNGQLIGYMVYRFAEKEGVTTGYIVDFLVTNHDDEALSALLSFTVSKLWQLKVDKIAIMKSTSFTWVNSVLKATGFRFNKPHLKVMATPEISKRIADKGYTPWVTFSDSDNDLSI
ncbi:hypothetical protein ACMXYX_00640 [Neptuniibacter sp. QD72_48]|uniref:hypothetical protein n=1 Tax=unclassified Neptuniibacter TaxID=2630693 RepID=UPI0039F45202